MSKKIRILQVTGSLRMGGLENVAMNIFRYADKDKYEFDFLVYGDKEEFFEREVRELGGRVYHISYPHNNPVKYMREMRQIMKEHGPYDVVHSHSLFNSGFVMAAAKKENIKIRIAHGHSDRRKIKQSFFRESYNNFMRYLINKYVTKRFACSSGAAMYLYGEKYSSDCYIVNNGVDVKKFVFNVEERNKIRDELNLNGCKVVGHVGRLVNVKNQEKIIDVFSYAYKQDRSLRLVIAGDGELKVQLQSKIDSLGLHNVANLIGIRSDVSSLLSAFDVYMMPSFYEGVSVSLIEAQASGVPCLVSSQAASLETRLTECINMLDVNDSVELWGDNLLSLVNAERMICASEAIIEKGYNIPDIACKVLKWYH